MKIGWLALTLFCFLSAFPAFASESKPTVEEQVIMKSFIGYVTALVYDEACNGTDPKSRYELKQKQNVMLLGNQQMLAARAGGVWHIRNPGKSVDEGVAHLLNVKQKVEKKFHDVLDAKGCDSEEAKQAAKAYQLFSEFHPSQIFSLIDNSITKAGGTVTSLQEIEAAGKK